MVLQCSRKQLESSQAALLRKYGLLGEGSSITLNESLLFIYALFLELSLEKEIFGSLPSSFS